jgi:hypothetical protein
MGPLIQRNRSDVTYNLEAYWIGSGSTQFQPVDVEILDTFGKEIVKIISPSLYIVLSENKND